jgi:hypothetical protein
MPIRHPLRIIIFPLTNDFEQGGAAWSPAVFYGSTIRVRSQPASCKRVMGEVLFPLTYKGGGIKGEWVN